MSTIQVPMVEGIVDLLDATDRTVDIAAYELIVLELYRRGDLSGGRATELLGIDRLAFMRIASAAGIPIIDMTEEEWEAEARLIAQLIGPDSESSPTQVR